ncbi:MAG: flagellar export chaperone FliS [Rhodanobacter sp.]|nr:MAG: flagellar export chaperone FliS [Rhodanobacter sp.]TAM14006.1 MAG: flagellar export chaperone FliS [Rhodanobacter sp.]TAM37118.1 MAG: flagellar export chaperone FliS [Rhodanobacter sp.]
MTNGYMRSASALYQQTRAVGRVENADPHQLIGMLYDGAIERIGQARNHVRSGDVTAKGAAIGKAIAIIGELRASLDMKAGGALAERLDALYDYINRRLLFAQLNDNERALAECVDLLGEVRDGWRGIRDNYLAGRSRGAV